MTPLRLLLDEDFNNDILRGLLRRKPDLDIMRVQDIEEIAGAADPWCWNGLLKKVAYSSPTM
jgi:hypothetical protein